MLDSLTYGLELKLIAVKSTILRAHVVKSDVAEQQVSTLVSVLPPWVM